MSTKSEQILDTWFGPLDSDGSCAADKVRRWFTKDAEFDQWLSNEFLADIERALTVDASANESGPKADELRYWVSEILLLDQFTRNVFRGSARMFEGDARALRLCRQILSHPDRDSLPFVYQAFVCMPLMHAESLDAQDQCVREFERLVEEAPEVLSKLFENNLKYAHAHRDIIARFGRFPHRNAALNRETTDEEAAFLKTPGSSF